MRTIVMLLAALALVAPGSEVALAAGSPQPLFAGQFGAREAGHVVYDDTVSPPWGAYALSPGAWIGDDLSLDMAGAPSNILNDVSFSVYHGSSGSSGLLDTCDVDIQLYDLSDTSFVGSLTFAGLHPALEPGYFAAYHAADLGPLNIALPAELFITMRIYNITGGATRVGQVFCDPPAVGSSSMDFYLDDRNADPPGQHYGWYWFGNPNGNFYWAVGVCPEPAALTGLLLGGLSLLRRR